MMESVQTDEQIHSWDFSEWDEQEQHKTLQLWVSSKYQVVISKEIATKSPHPFIESLNL